MSTFRAWQRILVLFSIGFLVRLFFGYIFYGGIDLGNYINLTDATLRRSLAAHISSCLVNYVPLNAFYWWLCGWLGVKTTLPIALCIKIIPIFFDALIGVLIYKIILKKRQAYAFTAGLLYALSPISIIVDCMHVQWESTFLFFLLLCFYIRDFYENSIKKDIFVGFLFVIAFLVKAVPLIFAPFLFYVPSVIVKDELRKLGRPILVTFGMMCAILCSFCIYSFFMIKTYRLTLSTFFNTMLSNNLLIICVLGAMSILIILCIAYSLRLFKRSTNGTQIFLFHQLMIALGGICTFFCVLYGFVVLLQFNLKELFDTMLRYFNQGAQLFGLPFAWPFAQSTLLSALLSNRIWFIAVIMLIALYYYKNKFSVFYAILLVMTFIFCFSGVLSNYYMWLIPFGLIEGFFSWTILFNLAASLVVIFHFVNPFSCKWPYLNTGAFITLKEFSFFAPPEFFTNIRWAWYIRIVSDYLIPFLSIMFMGYLVYRIKIKKIEQDDRSTVARSPFYFAKNGFVMCIVIINCLIGGLMFSTPSGYLAQQFLPVAAMKMEAYNLQFGNAHLWTFGPNYILNFFVLWIFLIITWACIAWYTTKKFRNEQS